MSTYFRVQVMIFSPSWQKKCVLAIFRQKRALFVEGKKYFYKYFDNQKNVIKIELSSEETSMTIPEYVERKVDRLLEFGVQKVIWVFTATQNVLVSEPGKPPVRYDWKDDIPLWETHTVNIGAYLRKKRIVV